jgi:hypothetical protein
MPTIKIGAVPPSLVDSYLKTTRAKVHLDALRNEIDLFRKSKPCSVFRKDNVKRGRYEIRIKIANTPGDIPLILGDLLYCLRSSLDQLVWSLARLTTSYPRGTQFPILEKRNAGTRKTFSTCTAGVPARAAKLIDSLQPYDRAEPSAHLLWRLNRLCNIDKHRRIPVHSDVVTFDFPLMPHNLVRSIEFNHDQQMMSVPLGLKGQMALDPKVSFNVIFGDISDGISCDFDGVANIYNFVADSVIPRFTRFFK